jgi:hypothetical protein
MTDFWHWLMRVDPPEGLPVRPRVTTRLAELEAELPRSRDLPLDDADLVGTAIIRAGDDIADGAMAAAQAAHRVPLGFVDIIAKHARAFLANELQVRYLRWRYRNLPDWQQQLIRWREANPGAMAPPVFTPENRNAHARQLAEWAEELNTYAATVPGAAAVPRRLPFDYVTGERAGRSHALLNLLFGEGYRNALREAAGIRTPRLQPAALWPRLVACLWPPPDALAVPRLRQLLQVRTIDPDVPPGALRAAVESVIERTSVVVNPERVNRATGMIYALAKRYAPDGDIAQLTDEALLELMGKPMSVDEFIHRLVIGFDIMADEADLIGPELLDKLLRVQGVESFLEMVLQKSGYEHGYTFEVFLVLRELFDELDPSRIWMQIVVGGKQGPDIGRIIVDELGRRVRLIQAKSYRDINALLRPSETGEIWRQMRSDLLRLKADGFMVTGPDGTRLPIDRTIEFAIDWWHLRKTSFRMDGIDPADLHSLRESTDEVSEAFKTKYVNDKVAELQAYLDSPEFRAELGLAEGEPGFVLDVKIVDRILPEGP